MAKAPRILICDDQPIIHETLCAYLDNEGFEHISAFDGLQALEMAKTGNPDLILLDLMMPAMREEIDRILGLEFGADDYIVKPFSARELIARIKAVLRRTSAAPEDSQGKTIRMDELEISLSNYEVRIGGKQVDFTPKEVEILYLLASNPGRVFEREQILSKVWGYDYFGDTRAVDTQIKRIRQKMPASECKWGIRTVYGVGYKFGLTE